MNTFKSKFFEEFYKPYNLEIGMELKINRKTTLIVLYINLEKLTTLNS